MGRFIELGWLALGGLRRTPLRVALTSLGIAIATGALVSMVGVALGFQEQASKPFQRLELANRIDVTPKGGRGRTQSQAPIADGKNAGPDVKDAGPSLDDEAVKKIVELPGVLLAYPDFRLETVQVNHGSVSKTVAVIGLPRKAGILRFVNETILAGQFFDQGEEAEVLLGKKAVQLLGFSSPEEAVGQRVTLKAKGVVPGLAGHFQFREIERELVVVGVWSPPSGRHGFTPDGLVLPTDIIRELPGVQFDSTLERLWQGSADPSRGYGRVVVRVRGPGDVYTVERSIQAMGLETQTLLSQFKQMQTAFVVMDLILTAVGTVALVVAGLGIINTLLMSVLERYKEIGVFKALGASDGDVRVLFLIEAALVGVLGGLGGLMLGWVVSKLIDLVVNAIARGKGIDDPILTFAFPPWLLGGALLFALVISLISGVYPASRAVRVDPIRALRSE